MIRLMKKGSAALALAAALLLATAVPARAGGFGAERGSGIWDGLWTWLAALRVPAATRPELRPGTATTKEGSGIDPDGAPAPAPPPAGGGTTNSQATEGTEG